MRDTNYGDLFDVRVGDQPGEPRVHGPADHTAPRQPVPRPGTDAAAAALPAQRGSGWGTSGFVDGFSAAAVLRDENPEAFDVLSRTEVTYRFSSPDAELSATRPMIGLDPYGGVREIRFNNRSMQPMRLRPADSERFYDAYRAFAEVLNRPEQQTVMRMQPGDCVIFDNTRILHAHWFQRRRRRTAPAGLLRRPGRAGEHARGTAEGPMTGPIPRRFARPEPVARMREMFLGEGLRDYLGEDVTMAQHMLQAAGLARAPARRTIWWSRHWCTTSATSPV